MADDIEPRRAGICWTGDCLQPAIALTFNDWPVCHEHGGEQVRKVAEAVKDVCWRATQYGQTEDGDTFAYIVTKGAMHRLIGAAQGAGISASFRSGPQETLPDPARHDADIAAAKAAGAAEVVARIDAVLANLRSKWHQREHKGERKASVRAFIGDLAAIRAALTTGGEERE